MGTTELRRLRTELAWSQGDVAAVLGVSRDSVSRWDRGALPTPEAALVALRALLRLEMLRDAFDGDPRLVRAERRVERRLAALAEGGK